MLETLLRWVPLVLAVMSYQTGQQVLDELKTQKKAQAPAPPVETKPAAASVPPAPKKPAPEKKAPLVSPVPGLGRQKAIAP